MSKIASIIWGGKRKYYTLLALFSLLIIAGGVLLSLGKMNADQLASTYEQHLSNYAASLKANPNGRTPSDLNKQPSLPSSSYAFVSQAYQKAAAKQAATNETIAYLKLIDDGLSPPKKGELENIIFYYQSIFFYDHTGASFTSYQKLKSPNAKKASVYSAQYTSQGKAAAEYIKSIKTATLLKKLHKQETTELQQALQSYKISSDDCAKKVKAVTKEDDMQNIREKCDDTLRKIYADSSEYYSYITFYPRGIKQNFRPTNVLIEQLKKQAALDYTNNDLEQIRLETRLNNRAAMSKVLLPKSKRDKDYIIKVDIVQILNQQSAEDIENATLTEEVSARYKTALHRIENAVALYDGLKDTSSEASSPFLEKLTSILDRVSEVDEESSYFDFFTESKKMLTELETPDYVKEEMQDIIADYEKALPLLKKYDEYNTRIKMLAEEEKTADFTKYSELSKQRRALYDEARNVLEKAEAHIIKAGETKAKIEKKADQTELLSQHIAKQYDELLQSQ